MSGPAVSARESHSTFHDISALSHNLIVEQTYISPIRSANMNCIITIANADSHPCISSMTHPTMTTSARTHFAAILFSTLILLLALVLVKYERNRYASSRPRLLRRYRQWLIEQVVLEGLIVMEEESSG
jgi:hypothetical protein